jgi:hypothetical protein
MYLPRLVNIVCEQPTFNNQPFAWSEADSKINLVSNLLKSEKLYLLRTGPNFDDLQVNKGDD